MSKLHVAGAYTLSKTHISGLYKHAVANLHVAGTNTFSKHTRLHTKSPGKRNCSPLAIGKFGSLGNISFHPHNASSMEPQLKQQKIAQSGRGKVRVVLQKLFENNQGKGSWECVLDLLEGHCSDANPCEPHIVRPWWSRPHQLICLPAQSARRSSQMLAYGPPPPTYPLLHLKPRRGHKNIHGGLKLVKTEAERKHFFPESPIWAPRPFFDVLGWVHLCSLCLCYSFW